MNIIKKVLKSYSLPLRIIIRPFNGFYAMKYEKQGSLFVALFNFIMLSISISFTSQYASIVVNQSNPSYLNSFANFLTLLAVVVLFCASNWAVTALTDGEGRFKDIIMVVCYAMTPIVITMIPMALISNLLTSQEGAFYTMVISLSIFWFVLLCFIGLVTVHNYSATKAVATVFLTFIALLIIVFLITLFFILLQQLWLFVNSLYTEIIYRIPR